VLEGGPCSVGLESSIVDVSGPVPRLLRPGGLALERLEQELGRTLERGPAILERPQAPGQLAAHYAPRTPLSLLSVSPKSGSGGARLGLLAFRSAPAQSRYGAVEALSASGDLAEAAARLFECLHRLDALGLDHIEAETLPAHGLGLAVNDRLTRAAAGHAKPEQGTYN
ncbi:MAG: Sua5 family C-terminal domain-containing protein, partial [bacterium]